MEKKLDISVDVLPSKEGIFPRWFVRVVIAGTQYTSALTTETNARIMADQANKTLMSAQQDAADRAVEAYMDGFQDAQWRG